MNVRYQMLRKSATPPQRMTAHSAGFDLFADLLEPVQLDPGKRVAIPTGIALEIPPGFEAQIRPRSGLALNSGLGVLNSPGTIDSDYRGEVKVILFNASESSVSITQGMRIAQMVICPIAVCTLSEATELSESDRGAGGFGHTGMH